MSVWAIIDYEKRSFRMWVCLCSHVIPLVHLTQWIPKDQQHKGERGRNKEKTEGFHFKVICELLKGHYMCLKATT